MTTAWNLSPAQWSEVLLTGVEPQSIAKGLHTQEINPWTANLLRHTQDSTTVLDMGSGRGQHSAMLALAGKQATLMDWSFENVQFSSKLFDALKVPGKFLRGDMLNPLPFADNTFDTVFSCGVFEYFSDEEIKTILKEAFRIAKKRVIVMVPNALSLPYRIGKFYQEKTGNWEWGGERPFPTLKPFFRSAGCQKLDEFSVAAKTSLTFLTMPGGRSFRKLSTRLLGLTDHAERALFKQGYLLITVGEK